MRIVFFIILIILFTSVLSQAQPTEPPFVPIDGGISYLIAAGILIGIRKLFIASKKK